MNRDERQAPNEAGNPVDYSFARRPPLEKLLLMPRNLLDLFLYVTLRHRLFL